MSTKVVFQVEMTCGGCTKAVSAMLNKVDGVESVDASWENNRVEVVGTASVDDMLAAIKITELK
eukprot:TRINITY_DN3116_c1_g1_i1.p1 TRINITY_DN3116_c1_g1~~TRINITY_DN3116_c1_g1_i1.p1  ORF type:complete len:64 (-),score=27.46 TRINITY_DN3116_c1_g1_i1:235-426(-)